MLASHLVSLATISEMESNWIRPITTQSENYPGWLLRQELQFDQFVQSYTLEYRKIETYDMPSYHVNMCGDF